MTLGARLGGRMHMVIGPKVKKQMKQSGKLVWKEEVPSFIEYWIEWPQPEFHAPNLPDPEPPEDPKVRDFLVGVAKLTAKAWLKEAKDAKGWHGDRVPYDPQTKEE
jgi:hypothetical protein